MLYLAETKCLKEAPRFKGNGASSQSFFPTTPNKIPEKSSCWLPDSLLRPIKHPEKADSHAAVQDSKGTSGTTWNILFSNSCFPILYTQELSSSSFLRRSFLWLNNVYLFSCFIHSDHSCSWAHKTRGRSKSANTQHKVTVWGAGLVNRV